MALDLSTKLVLWLKGLSAWLILSVEVTVFILVLIQTTFMLNLLQSAQEESRWAGSFSFGGRCSNKCQSQKQIFVFFFICT